MKQSIQLVWFIMLNATFNNILVISWRSLLLVEETGGPDENHRDCQLHIQSVPIATDVVSSNFDQGEVYNM
jgi:hypothetical protein